MRVPSLFPASPPLLGEGAAWLEGFLPVEEQIPLVRLCRDLMEGEAGGYVPIVRGGGRMRVRMLCLGRHWNARTYTYEETRSDFDGAPVAPVPSGLSELASRAAAAAGYTFTPDIALINWYGDDGRMGLHQDKDESRMSLEAGHPVVSVSIGDTARFLFGGTRRRDPVQAIDLASGDAFVFGGPARLRYHGVARILPGTGPAALDLAGRINLTFRRY